MFAIASTFYTESIPSSDLFVVCIDFKRNSEIKRLSENQYCLSCIHQKMYNLAEIHKDDIMYNIYSVFSSQKSLQQNKLANPQSTRIGGMFVHCDTAVQSHLNLSNAEATFVLR